MAVRMKRERAEECESRGRIETRGDMRGDHGFP